MHEPGLRFLSPLLVLSLTVVACEAPNSFEAENPPAAGMDAQPAPTGGPSAPDASPPDGGTDARPIDAASMMGAEAGPPGMEVMLTVRFLGNGSGTVSDQGSALSCSGTCSASFARGSTVNLVATAAAGSSTAWSAPCAGSGACQLKLEADTTVSVTFTSLGALAWRAASADVNAIAVGGGEILVAGTITGSVTLGGTTLTSAGDADIFLARYKTTGEVVWSKSFGGARQDRAQGIAVDAAGNIYVTGRFVSPEVDFGGKVLTYNPAGSSFLAKYSPAGQLLWLQPKGGAALLRDADGTLLAAGYPGGRYRDTGETVWELPIATNDVAVQGNRLVFAGTFNTPRTLAGTNLVPVGLQDVFVLGCEATGMPTWAVGVGSPEDDYVYAVATGSDGSAFIGGEFEGAMTIAGTTLRSIEGSDMFVVELNGSTGAPVWAASRGQAGRDYVLDALADSMGNVLVVGWGVPPTRLNGANGMPAMSFELLPDNHAYALARTADGQGVLLGGNGWLGALK